MNGERYPGESLPFEPSMRYAEGKNDRRHSKPLLIVVFIGKTARQNANSFQRRDLGRSAATPAAATP